MKHELIAGAFLVVSLAILGLIGWGIHQRNLKVAAEAAYTQQSVELEGAKRALLAKPTEVVKFVEVPAAVKAAVRSGAMIPIAATKIAAEAQPVEIPCPDTTPPTSVDADVPPRALHTNPVVFGLTGEFFVGKIKGGAVEYTGSLKGTARMDETEAAPAWHTDLDFAPEDVKVDIKVSTDIAKAVEAYNVPWLKKHTALACPGIGVTYNPLNDRAVDVALTCGYSFVWF